MAVVLALLCGVAVCVVAQCTSPELAHEIESPDRPSFLPSHSFLHGLPVPSSTRLDCAASAPTEVKNGFFAGRSGNVVFSKPSSGPGRNDALDASAVFADPSQRLFRSSGMPLAAEHFADVLSRSLGNEGMNPAFDTTPYVTSSLTSRARAALVVGVHGLTGSLLSASAGRDVASVAARTDAARPRSQSSRSVNRAERLGQGERPTLVRTREMLVALRETSPAASVTALPLAYNAYPFDTAAMGQSLASAAYPSRHGIVAGAWARLAADAPNGFETVQAYATPDAEPKMGNLADSLAQAFDGKSLLLSVSSSAQAAKAFSLHPDTLAAHPAWTAQGKSSIASAAFNPLTGAFDLTSRSGAISPELSAVLAGGAFTPANLAVLGAPPHTVRNLAGSVTVALNADGVTVEVTRHVPKRLRADEVEALTSTFNLRNPADAALFGELVYADRLARALADGRSPLAPLIKDGVPDLLAFTFASLPGIRAEHKVSSEASRAAVALVDISMANLVSSFNFAYSNEGVAAIVAYGQQTRTWRHGAEQAQALLQAAPASAPAKASLLSEAPAATTETSKAVVDTLGDARLKAQLSAFFPSLQVPAELLGSACGQLTRRFNGRSPTRAGSGLRVYCAAPAGADTVSFLEVSTSVTSQSSEGSQSTHGSEGYSSHNLMAALTPIETMYNLRIEYICRFVGIFLFFLTLYALFSVAYMDFKKDQQLWGTLNPSWVGGGPRR